MRAPRAGAEDEWRSFACIRASRPEPEHGDPPHSQHRPQPTELELALIGQGDEALQGHDVNGVDVT